MDGAKEEFLIKPSPYHTKDEIVQYIASNPETEKGKKIFPFKNFTDFEIVRLNKMTHFTDHHGNYLTKSGLKIDDFST